MSYVVSAHVSLATFHCVVYTVHTSIYSMYNANNVGLNKAVAQIVHPLSDLHLRLRKHLFLSGMYGFLYFYYFTVFTVTLRYNSV